MKSVAVRSARALIALLIVVFFALALRDNLSDLRNIELDLSLGWIAPTVLLGLGGAGLLPLAWRLLVLGQLSDGQLSRGDARALWWKSQSARYLPTGVAGMAARVWMSQRAGVPRDVAAISVGAEIGAIVGWSSFLGAIVVGDNLPYALRLVSIIGGAAVLAGMPVALSLVNRSQSTDRRLDLPVFIGGTMAYGASILLHAVRSVCIAAALFGMQVHSLRAVVSADLLGAVAGILSVAPSGIGTREAASVAIAAPTIGAGDALTLAVTFRAVDLVVEIVWLAIVARRRSPDLEPDILEGEESIV